MWRMIITEFHYLRFVTGIALFFAILFGILEYKGWKIPGILESANVLWAIVFTFHFHL